MIKYFCDICGKETSEQRAFDAVLPFISETKRDGFVYDTKPYLICEKCAGMIARCVEEIERYFRDGN